MDLLGHTRDLRTSREMSDLETMNRRKIRSNYTLMPFVTTGSSRSLLLKAL